MKNKLILEDFVKIINSINNTIQENIKYLSKLDSTISEGDHGITIARGFRNVIKKIEDTSPKSISEILEVTGSTLMSTMGGATGPIFGSIFTEMGKAISNKKSISL